MCYMICVRSCYITSYAGSIIYKVLESYILAFGKPHGEQDLIKTSKLLLLFQAVSTRIVNISDHFWPLAPWFKRTSLCYCSKPPHQTDFKRTCCPQNAQGLLPLASWIANGHQQAIPGQLHRKQGWWNFYQKRRPFEDGFWHWLMPQCKNAWEGLSKGLPADRPKTSQPGFLKVCSSIHLAMTGKHEIPRRVWALGVIFPSISSKTRRARCHSPVLLDSWCGWGWLAMQHKTGAMIRKHILASFCDMLCRCVDWTFNTWWSRNCNGELRRCMESDLQKMGWT